MKNKSLLFILLLILFFTVAAVKAQSSKINYKPIWMDTLNTKARSLVVPEYPLEARKGFVFGTVEVDVTVDETGNIISVNSARGPALLREVSSQVAQQSKFTPILLSGVAVRFTGTIVYHFELPDEFSDRSNYDKQLLRPIN